MYLISKVMNELIELFKNQHGYYSKSLQFQVVIFSILIILFFNTYFKSNYGFVIILIVFTLYLANLYVTINQTSLQDFNKDTMYKLRVLQSKIDEYQNKLQTRFKKSNKLTQKQQKNLKLDSMYLDANLIHFLYSILPIYEYNDSEFYSLLNGTNNILTLRKEIEEIYESNKKFPENISQMLEASLILKTKTVNNLHNFIYSIPKTNTMYKYLDEITNHYNILITRNIDKIYKMYNLNIKRNGINNSTLFITYDNTKSFDTTSNHSTIGGNLSNKLIPFFA